MFGSLARAAVTPASGAGAFSSSAASSSALNNGLRVLSAPSADAEDPVSVSLSIRAGSRFNPSGDTAAAHYLAASAFGRNSTGALAHDVAAAINATGASFSANVDRETVTLSASGLPSELPAILRVLCGAAAGPDVSNPLENDKVVASMASAAAARDSDSGAVLAGALHAAAYGSGNGLGASPIAPSYALPGEWSASATQDLMDATYGANNMVLTIVGGGDHSEAVASSGLDSLSPSALAPAAREGAVYRGGEVRAAAAGSAGSTLVGVAFNAGSGLAGSAGSRAALAVAGAVLGEGNGYVPLGPVSLGGSHAGRLGAQVVSRAGVGAAAGFGAVYSDGGLFGATAASSAGAAGATAEALVGELAGLASAGVSAGELDAAKALVSGRLLMGAESRAGLAGLLGRGALLGKGESVADAVAAVQAVSRADVSQAVAQVLGSPMSLAVIGDDSTVASSATLAKAL